MPRNSNLKITISAVDKTKRALKSAKSNIERTARKLDRTGKVMRRTGRRMTMGITMPLVGAGTAATKFAADFSNSTRKANTMMKLSEDELGNFKEGVMDLSDKYAQSSDDIMKSAFDVSSVLHTGPIKTLGILEQSAKGATGGFTDISDVTDTLTTTMSIFDIEADESGRIMDILTASMEQGKMTMSDLVNTFPRAAELSNSLGTSVEEVAAGFSLLTKKSGNAHQAATKMKGITQSLVKPSKELKNVLHAMGYESGQAAVQTDGFAVVMKRLSKRFDGNATALGKLFPNVRGLSGIMPLLSNETGEYGKILEEVTNSQGKANEFFEEASKATGVQLRQAWISLKNAIIGFAEVFAPTIKEMADKVKDFAKSLSDLDKQTKRTVVKLLAIAAVTGPVVYGLGLMASGLSKVLLGFKAITGYLAGGGAFMVGLLGLTGILIEIIGFWLLWKKLMDKGIIKLDDVKKSVLNFNDNLENTIQLFKAWLESINWLTDSLRWLNNKILKPLTHNIKMIADGIRDNLIPQIKSFVKSSWTIKNAQDEAGNSAKEFSRKMNELHQETRKAKDSMTLGAKAAKRIQERNKEAGEAAKKHTETQKEQNNVFDKATNQVEDFWKKLGKLKNQTDDNTESASNLIEKINTLGDKIQSAYDKALGAAHKEIKSYPEELADVIMEAKDKQEKYSEKISDIRQRLGEADSAEERERIKENLAEYKAKLQEQKETLGRWSAYQKMAAKSAEGVKKIINEREMEREMDAFSLAMRNHHQKIENIWKEYNATKESVAKQIKANTKLKEKVSELYWKMAKTGVDNIKNLTDAGKTLIGSLKTKFIRDVNSMQSAMNNLNFPSVGGYGFTPAGSFQTGTSYVPKTGVYQLHKGEAVIPARENKKGITVNITGNTLLDDNAGEKIGNQLVDNLKYHLDL